VAGAVSGVQLDVAAPRLDGARFDLIVITNVLPYFDDRQLTTALANLAGRLAPAGVLLHNEGRPLLAAVAADLRLPLRQARTASIARVLGAPPLSDVVYIHQLAR
jgi:hypothetical protein